MRKFDTLLFDYDRTLRFPLISWEDYTFEYFEGIGYPLEMEQKSSVKRWVYYYFQSPEFIVERENEEIFWSEFYLKYTRLVITDGTQAQKIAPILQDKVLNDCFPKYHDYVPEITFQVLKHLQQEGYKMGIITNRSSSIDEDLVNLALAEFFPQVIVSGLVGVMKPQPEIFHLALKQIQSTTDKSIYIGDNYYADVLGAVNAGMQAILVDPDNLFPEADCPVILTLAELPALLDEF